MIPLIPIFLLLAGGGAIVAFALSGSNDEPPVHEPDAPAAPGKTGYKLVDAILPQLTAASQSSGIPLGLLVSWIAVESGGKLGEVTKLDERGLFQLMPDESKSLGLDHDRLSTDLTYSINGGLALIGKYMGAADALGVARRGSSYYWTLVKLVHTVGGGATKKIVDAARGAGAADSWTALEGYALDHNSELLSATKHSPSKWFPFLDKMRKIGWPFGFGDDSSSTTVVGGEVRDDIIDPLDCLPKSA